MAQLPREYLDDISSQRFQENVARQNNGLQKTVSTNNKTITESLNSSVADLQQQITALNETYVDISFSLTAGTGTTNYTHGIGSIPSRWVITDITEITGSIIPGQIIRTAWTTSTITLINYSTGSCQHVGTIRIYK